MPESLHKAVALEYGANAAPVVTAAGSGDLADSLVREAVAQGVPILRDPQLALRLSSLPVGASIPRDVYYAVAVVLSWVYWLEGRTPPQRSADQAVS